MARRTGRFPQLAHPRSCVIWRIFERFVRVSPRVIRKSGFAGQRVGVRGESYNFGQPLKLQTVHPRSFGDMAKCGTATSR